MNDQMIPHPRKIPQAAVDFVQNTIWTIFYRDMGFRLADVEAKLQITPIPLCFDQKLCLVEWSPGMWSPFGLVARYVRIEIPTNHPRAWSYCLQTLGSTLADIGFVLFHLESGWQVVRHPTHIVHHRVLRSLKSYGMLKAMIRERQLQLGTALALTATDLVVRTDLSLTLWALEMGLDHLELNRASFDE